MEKDRFPQTISFLFDCLRELFSERGSDDSQDLSDL